MPPISDLWAFDPTTSTNNSDIGGHNIAENNLPSTLNNALRELCMYARRLCNQGSDIASASTTAIGATGTSFYAKVTGTTTITALGTANAGLWRFITFTGALTLTHNATSLIIPGGANVTTAAGDTMLVISEGSGNWRVLAYTKASGNLLVSVATADIADAAVTYAKIQDISAASRLLGRGSAGGSGDTEEISLGTGISMSTTTLSATGKVTQVVLTDLNTLLTDATTIPNDNTIPQNTEGVEVMTAAITPVNASSTLCIEVSVQVGAGATSNATVALFVDTTADALAAAGSRLDVSWQASVHFIYFVSAASTSARTYKVRAGLASGTISINGVNGTQRYGGVCQSTLKITELLP